MKGGSRGVAPIASIRLREGDGAREGGARACGIRSTFGQARRWAGDPYIEASGAGNATSAIG